MGNKIDGDPQLHWCVKDILKRRNRIISKVKSRYWQTSHKFIIRIPKTVDKALEIERENDNTAWYSTVQKDMINERKEFQKWDKKSQKALYGKKLVGYQNIGCHMIFDVKMDSHFACKDIIFTRGTYE